MRKWRLLGVTAAVLLVPTSAFMLWPRPSRVTRESCDRIREGMSRAEVETIVGPPGDYRAGPTGAAFDYDFHLADIPMGTTGDKLTPWDGGNNWPPAGATQAEWAGDTAVLEVTFDAAGHVLLAVWYSVERFEPRAFEDLLWQVGRRLEKWLPEK
jgi:hypothetical protein